MYTPASLQQPSSMMFMAKKLVLNFSIIFLILAPNIVVVQKLTEVHIKWIEGQDFTINKSKYVAFFNFLYVISSNFPTFVSQSC